MRASEAAVSGAAARRGAGGLPLGARLVRVCRRPVTERDRARAAVLLTDWIGIAAAGAATVTAGAVRAGHGRRGDAGPCSAVGMGAMRADDAAYLNGALGTLLEMDDLHRASILHAGDVVIPAALAAVQAKGLSGDGLLDAIVRGYEAALRVGEAAAAGGYSAWYNTGTCGVFGASVAAASAMGLSEQRMLDALGHAGMQAGGLWQCRLDASDSKCLATAHAARAGVLAASMAAAGLRGPARILEGEMGFFPVLYPAADLSRVDGETDAPWKVHEISLKPWSACRHVHAAIGAALKLRAAVDPAEVARVEVDTYAAGRDFCDCPSPVTSSEARFSFQHAVAVTLLRGAPKIADFQTGALRDQGLAELRSRVSVVVDDSLSARFPARMGAGLRATLMDGAQRVIRCEDAPGDPEWPMDADARRTKFTDNMAAAGVRPQVVAGVLAALDGLTGATTLDELGAALGRVTEDIAAGNGERLT